MPSRQLLRYLHLEGSWPPRWCHYIRRTRPHHCRDIRCVGVWLLSRSRSTIRVRLDQRSPPIRLQSIVLRPFDDLRYVGTKVWLGWLRGDMGREASRVLRQGPAPQIGKIDAKSGTLQNTPCGRINAICFFLHFNFTLLCFIFFSTYWARCSRSSAGRGLKGIGPQVPPSQMPSHRCCKTVYRFRIQTRELQHGDWSSLPSHPIPANLTSVNVHHQQLVSIEAGVSR